MTLPIAIKERIAEKLYLVIGTEDGIHSAIWPESKLHHGVLSALFYNPEECSQEESEYWEVQLRTDANWSWDRCHFHEGIGEIGHLDIYRITEHRPTPKVDELIQRLSIRSEVAMDAIELVQLAKQIERENDILGSINASLSGQVDQLASEQQQWRDISSAPKDGTAILLYWPAAVPLGRDCMEAGRWSEEKGHWTNYCEEHDEYEWTSPRYWQPLPNPPTP